MSALKAYWVADYDVYAAQDEAQALAFANALAAPMHGYSLEDVTPVLDATLDEPLTSDNGPATLRQMLVTAEPGYLAGYEQ
ncbi:hypothetical protein [Pseudomonas costantinii]|uniref:Uncharacterized protein n=1 Tax=Pseudomonas costantinii TaxID=168469 RepID=A0A1H4TZV7_9PSED|nr:hypothetical protein [Pseudomonas costantinii]SEC62053.1 hypothetical protein SAMN04515675_0008 [Pseudomonas costantinii]SEC63750.1 hypothetical protein SAMN04515675_0063 [Pseudomonas costantinii]